MKQQFVSIKIQILILISFLFLTGCNAEFGLGQNSKPSGDPAAFAVDDGDPAPPDIGDDDPNPPDLGDIPAECAKGNVKVIVSVIKMKLGKTVTCGCSTTTRMEEVCSKDAEIDLCELGKDFFTVLETNLNPAVRNNELFNRIDLVLAATGHRVTSKDGTEKLCDLNVSAPELAGLKFVADPAMAYDVSKKVGFDFPTDGVSAPVDGKCQLKSPIGNFVLKIL